jgi:hypothetical protein
VNRRLLAALALIATSCAQTAGPVRTRLELDVTRRELSAPPRSVLVLSPAALRTALGSEQAARLGELSTSEAPTEWLERALFEAGWDPVPRGNLARLVKEHATAIAIREVLARPDASLDGMADVLGPAGPADVVLVVKSWRAGWAPVREARLGTRQLCAASSELALELRARDGRVLWTGRGMARASDTADLGMTSRLGSVSLTDPERSCVGEVESGCASCPLSGSAVAAAEQARTLASALVAEVSAAGRVSR